MTLTSLSDRIRRRIFYTVSSLLLGGIFILDLVDIFDPCLMIYGATVLISIVCGVMFLDWWRLRGSATSVYKWITFLLFALAFNDWMQFVARYNWFFAHAKYEQILQEIYWEYRSIPKLVALIFLFAFAIGQRFGGGGTTNTVDTIAHDLAEIKERIANLENKSLLW